MAKVMRSVIVDDERLARNKLRSMLRVHPEIEIVGEADCVAQAIDVIQQSEPDVVFLDVQMPGASGFELLDMVETSFKVIFVTAFDEHAIRAFEVNALDYLLKPVNANRLARAIARLSTVTNPVMKGSKALEYDDYLLLSTGNHSTFLKVSSIKCIRAAGVYSEIWTADNKRTLVHKPLNDWAERLPAKCFSRIHRGAIVNVEFVERMVRLFNYSYEVYLRDIADPFVMSRRYAAKLKDQLN